jgi:hypothetical protein
MFVVKKWIRGSRAFISGEYSFLHANLDEIYQEINFTDNNFISLLKSDKGQMGKLNAFIG